MASRWSVRGASTVQYLVLVALVVGAIAALARYHGLSLQAGSRVLGEKVRTQSGAAALGGGAAQIAARGEGDAPRNLNDPDAFDLEGEVIPDPGSVTDERETAGDDAAKKNYDDVKWGRVKGPAFVKGKDHATAVHPADVSQGQIANCYLIGPLASLAKNKPDWLYSGIKVKKEGTFLVRLFVNGKAKWIEVDDRFPVKDGKPVYAQPGQKAKSGPELWPMLYERAYAKQKGGYNAIGHGGVAADALATLTGKPSTVLTPSKTTIRTLATYVNNGYAVVAGTPKESDHALFKDDTLATWHVYWVESVDVKKNTVTLRNPWGWNEKPITLTWDQFKAIMVHATTNPIYDRKPRR